ncbi:MAG: outer membrane protein transport protein [Bacteroidales bacterium]|jgi:long-chain fatty acid transport protein|nr:outer membrane protein transport protein [Bacteroidales bacterium]
MKKLTTLILAISILPLFSFAGGIVTNSNQSASWVRMLCRDASTNIDAVYFNPAGLTKLNDGFYFSLSNQSITQTKTITNSYPYLNNSEYVGDVSAPLFPSVYAAYKLGKLAFSVGFNPVGGGGGAQYDQGLPSFETGISDLVPGLQAAGQNVTAYSVDAYFEGTSVYWGLQAGISYEINNMISVFGGLRYNYGVNTYNGHLNDIMITLDGTPMSASGFFGGLATSLATGAEDLQPLIDDYDIGTYTITEAEDAGYIDATKSATLQGKLLSLGVEDPANYSINNTQATFNAGSDQYTAKSDLLADQTADVKQVATGYTPILGVNISPNDKINIGIKYEFKTELEFENETESDITTGFEANGTQITMFPDGGKFRNDIPAVLSVGASYQVLEDFKLSTGLHMYFDKNANWEGRESSVNNNFYELALGGEYSVSEKVLLSAGFLHAETGVGAGYQTDLSYSLSSNTVGFGGKLAINPMFDINLGMMYTMYSENDRIIDYGAMGSYKETYDTSTLTFAIGVDINLNKAK